MVCKNRVLCYAFRRIFFYAFVYACDGGGVIGSRLGGTAPANCQTSWSAVGGGLPSGTSGQTLRHDGTNWVANSLLYNNGTSVGIGTAIPAEKLDVIGNIGFQYGFALTNPTVANKKVLETGWDSTLGDFLKLYTAGTGAENANPKITILRGGNVGIGTNAPSGKLEINKGANYPAIIFDIDTSSTNDGKSFKIITKGSGGNTDVIQYMGNWGGNYIWQRDSGSGIVELMRLNANNGNLGIGTAAPGAKLEVNGAVKITDGTQGNGKVLTSDANGLDSWQPASGGGGGYWTLANNILYPTTIANTVNIGAAGSGSLGIGTGTANPPVGRFNIYSGVNVGYLTYANAGGNDGLAINSYYNSADTNYRVVDLVALGFSSPASGGSQFRFFTQPRSNGAPQQRMTIDKDGGVTVSGAGAFGGYGIDASGIQLTTPSLFTDKLAVGTGVTGGLINRSGTVNAKELCINNVCQTSWSSVGGPWTISGNNIYNNNTGNVGIGGVTAPEYELDVGDRMRVRQGAKGTAGIWFFQSVPNNDSAFVGMANDSYVGLYGNSGALWGLLMNTTNGNVGVGVAAPGYKLDVNGALRLEPSAAPTVARGVMYFDSTSNRFRCSENGTSFVNCIGGGGGGISGSGTLNYVPKFTPDGSTLGNSLIFDNGTNVGIGTTAPSAKLDVAGGYIYSTNAEAGSGILRVGAAWGFPGMYVETAGKDMVLGTNSGAIRIRTNGANDRMFINTAGNVGIGTATPGDKLVVQGGVIIDNSGLNSGTSANSLRLGGSGSGEFIASKRTAGGNQYGLDFFAGGVSRISVSNNGYTTLDGLRIRGLDTVNTIYQASGALSLTTNGQNLNLGNNIGGDYALTVNNNVNINTVAGHNLCLGADCRSNWKPSTQTYDCTCSGSSCDVPSRCSTATIVDLTEVTATCPSGGIAIGGGGDWAGIAVTSKVLYTYPGGTENSWACKSSWGIGDPLIHCRVRCAQ